MCWKLRGERTKRDDHAPEILVEFIITGINLSPDEITGIIGTIPTKTWMLGEPIQKTLLKRKIMIVFVIRISS